VGDVQSLQAVPWTSVISGPVKILKADYRELPSQQSDSQKHVARFFYADVPWTSGVHEEVSDLAVESQEVVPIKAGASDGRSMVEATMRAVPVVVVKPGKKMVVTVLRVLI
jgi:hypothetical protein